MNQEMNEITEDGGCALLPGARDGGRTSGEGIRPWNAEVEVEPWAEAVDGAELLNGLAKWIRRYVVLEEAAVDTLALWVLHTHAFELRDVTVYIGVESPQKRCGKTTLLTVLSEVVNRPIVAANISSPAFFRVIEEMQPTLMIDEADTALHRNDELRGILNSGYKRKTAYVVRVASEGPRNDEWRATRDESQKLEAEGGMRPGRVSRLVRYSSWCPKAIATIKHLPETLQDRCIVIEMHRKRMGEPCERLKEMSGLELRRKCARFVRDYGEAIGSAEPRIPVELHDRAGEIWEPLLALADLAQGGWPERARRAAMSLTRSGQEEGAIGALLFDIMILFTRGDRERLFSRTLARELNEWGERPWMELRKGKEVTEMWLARQLRPYGLRPKTMWIGEELAKGYLREDFDEVFRRYMPRKDAKAMLEDIKVSAEGMGGESPGLAVEGRKQC
jgi:hypothetical protein